MPPFIERTQVVIPSDPVEGRHVQDTIESILRQAHIEDRDIFGIKLAVEEAIVNAIKHGNTYDIGKKVTITYCLDQDEFSIQVQDEGNGFDPSAVPDPTLDENRDKPGGRGVMLMKEYMDTDFGEKGNDITMKKRVKFKKILALHNSDSTEST